MIQSFTLSTTAFNDGATIPSEYVCAAQSGSDKLPQLNWSGLPQGTKGLLIVMDDVDAAPLTGYTFPHFVAYLDSQELGAGNVAEITPTSFPYSAPTGPAVISDLPPCNPEVSQHRYVWKAYALDRDIDQIPAAVAFINKIKDAENSGAIYFLANAQSGEPYVTRAVADQALTGYILGTGSFSGVMTSKPKN